jgi:hypothetical protein
MGALKRSGAARGTGIAAMKAREERQKVMIRARMRDGVHWHDVCVLNMSAHGLGIQAAEPPERGTYVEICRGRHSIIARVAWSKGHRAGLRAQDAIFIPAFVSDSGDTAAARPAFGGRPVERRRFARTAGERHEHSRFRARSIEFACLALVGSALAMTLVGSVQQALARPLSRISQALD